MTECLDSRLLSLMLLLCKFAVHDGKCGLCTLFAMTTSSVITKNRLIKQDKARKSNKLLCEPLAAKQSNSYEIEKNYL
jgi:hypothetical protein